jgi:plastocyanin
MPTTDRAHSLLVAVAALALAASVGVVLQATGAISRVQAKDQSVTIKNFAFTPDKVTVTVGSTVTWTNSDTQVQHTVTSDSGGTLDSGPLSSGQSYGKQFDTAGTYAYHCEIHQGMTGTIVVTATAPTPRPTATPRPTPLQQTGPPSDIGQSPTSPASDPPIAALAAIMVLAAAVLGFGVARHRTSRVR